MVIVVLVDVVNVQCLQMRPQCMDHLHGGRVQSLHLRMTDVKAGNQIRIVDRFHMLQKALGIGAGGRRSLIKVIIPVPHILRGDLHTVRLGKGQQLDVHFGIFEA